MVIKHLRQLKHQLSENNVKILWSKKFFFPIDLTSFWMRTECQAIKRFTIAHEKNVWFRRYDKVIAKKSSRWWLNTYNKYSIGWCKGNLQNLWANLKKLFSDGFIKFLNSDTRLFGRAIVYCQPVQIYMLFGNWLNGRDKGKELVSKTYHN